MEPLSGLGRVLILLGLGIVALGLVLTLAGRLGFLGRLPGDIVYRKGNLTLYFPLATSLLVSVIITLVFWLLKRQ